MRRSIFMNRVDTYVRGCIINDRATGWYTNRIKFAARNVYVEQTIQAILCVLAASCLVGLLCALEGYLLSLESWNVVAGMLLGTWIGVFYVLVGVRHRRNWQHVMTMGKTDLECYAQLLYWKHRRFLSLEEVRSILRRWEYV